MLWLMMLMESKMLVGMSVRRRRLLGRAEDVIGGQGKDSSQKG